MRILRLTPEQAVAVTRQLERARAWFATLMDAFREMARRLTRPLAAVVEFLRRYEAAAPLGAATTQRRPAWMSPYGPPIGRHRR
ncbi:hypothetical protein ACIOHS_26895 [Streptomyces sp. NPDC088253]|uniref:hypothetical protein n=1 Tax=Streptomyces sp. NPDC088253 TaxID=3365846 RepID=UPI0037FF5E19